MSNLIDVSEFRGPLNELLDQFSGPNGRERFEEFKLWQKGVSSRLLQPVTVVPVSWVRRFVARECLAAANVGVTGRNFQSMFLDKVEENVPGGRVAISTLVKGSLDPEIMVELGRDRRVTQLTHFFKLLEKQAKGQAGPLLANGGWNVAYCFGNDGNFWAVGALWGSFRRYWSVGARSVGHPYVWRAGGRVLSQAA